MIKVNVANDDMRKMERAHYEAESSKSILAFIMKQTDILDENLNRYMADASEKWTACEKMKYELGKKYCPDEYEVDKCDYSFDFETNTIDYTQVM